jgi:hypothetical protein
LQAGGHRFDPGTLHWPICWGFAALAPSPMALVRVRANSRANGPFLGGWLGRAARSRAQANGLGLPLAEPCRTNKRSCEPTHRESARSFVPPRRDRRCAALPRTERAAKVLRANLAEFGRLSRPPDRPPGVVLRNRQSAAGDEHEVIVTPAARPFFVVTQGGQRSFDGREDRNEPLGGFGLQAGDTAGGPVNASQR